MSKGKKFAVQYYKKIGKRYKDRKWQFSIASTFRMLKRTRAASIRKEEFQTRWIKNDFLHNI